MQAETIRKITVQATNTGVSETTAALGKLKDAQEGVAASATTTATVTDMASKRQLSAAEAYRRQTLAVVDGARQQDQLARAVKTATAAFNQGVLGDTNSAQAKAALAARVHLLTQKYGEASTATRGLAATTAGLEAAFAPILKMFLVLGVLNFARTVETDTASLSEQAQQLTVSVEALQAYRAEFLVNGVAVEKGNTLIQRFSKSVGEAKDTAGPARSAFTDLGVVFSDLGSTEGALSKTAARLLAISDANERARLEAALFGRSGLELEPVLTSLAKPIDVLIAKGKELGMVLDEDLAKKADEASDRIALSWAQLKTALAPIITSVAVTISYIFDPPNVAALKRDMAARAAADSKRWNALVGPAPGSSTGLRGVDGIAGPDGSVNVDTESRMSGYSLKGTGLLENQAQLRKNAETAGLEAIERAKVLAVEQQAELVLKAQGRDQDVLNLNYARAKEIVDAAAAAQGTWTSKQIESVAAAAAQAGAYQKIRETFTGYLSQLEESARLAGLSNVERENELAIIKGAQVVQKNRNVAEKDLTQNAADAYSILEKSGNLQSVIAELEKKRDNQLRLQNQHGQDNLDLLNTEISLIGASNAERAVALAQLQAEQDLKNKYGTGFNAAAPTADQQKYIDLQKEQAAAAVEKTRQETLYNESLTYQLDLLDQIDSATRDAASGMAESFGSVGKAIGEVATTMTGYAALQEKYREDEKARVKAKTNDTAAQIKAARGLANAEEQYYGDMISAAKGFFGEKTAAYKVLQAVESTYNAFRLAGNLMAMASDIEAAATKAATVPTIVASNEAIAASGVTAGAANIFAELGPWGFPVVAAMLAVMLGLGFAGGSGGAPKVDTTAKDRQAAQGAGSILGDTAAKSDSISKSLEELAKNTNKDLEYSSEMVSSLRAIQQGIGTASSLLARQLDVNGALDTSKLGLGTSSHAGASGIAGAVGWSGFLGAAILDPILALGGLFGNLFGKTKTTVSLQDQGIEFASTSVAKAIEAGAATIYQQVEITKKSTALFGLISNTKTSSSTQNSALPDELQRQITLMIGGLRDTVVSAASKLGIEGAAAAIDSFTIDIGKISLKDMTGEEIQTALNESFSKLGDDMAATAAPFLSSMQKVGEGYLQTLSRVAQEVMVVSDAMKTAGVSFDLVGMESITASDRLVKLAGDLDAFSSQSQFFAENFLTSAQALAPVQRAVSDEMARLGESGITTKAQFAEVVRGIDVSTEAGAELYTSLMNVAPAFAKVADASDALAAQQLDLQIQLLQATGDAVGATNLERQKELSSLDDSLVSLQRQIYAAEDLKVANDNLAAQSEAASSLASKRQDMEILLLQTTGDAVGATALQRQKELAALDASLVPLQQQIYAAQDLKSAYSDLSNGISGILQTAKDSASEVDQIAKTWGSANDALTKASNALMISDQSLSPQQKYMNAAAQFDQLRSSALGGDSTAANDLASFASQFLQTSYQYNAATPTYGQDFSYVQQTLKDVAGYSSGQQSLMQQQADSLKNSVALLQSIKDSLADTVKNTEAISDLRDDVAKLTSEVSQAMRQARLA